MPKAQTTIPAAPTAATKNPSAVIVPLLGDLAAVLSAQLAALDAPPRACHPDAALMAACAELSALERRFIALHDEIEDDDERDVHLEPLWPPMRAARDRILAAPARTMEGLRAKLEATLLTDLEWLRNHDDALAERKYGNESMQAAIIVDLVALLKPDVPEVPRGRAA